ncbi:hypothetical protein [Peptacetobacter hiranonis]|uniref:hypothetical protein n=1 Tax=Peptacetobacter hiranonis TaxID=89152 RepID=UPI0022E2303A|nr:hypothetical protein [Peptacetobacter hiranonis]
MEIMGFVIWVICGLLFVGIGIYDYRSKKQVGFWANFDVPEVEDVIGFNKAVGRLFIIYGVVFILIGIPLIPSIFYKNMLLVFIPIIGTVFETIWLMVYFVMKIEKDYYPKKVYKKIEKKRKKKSF